MSQRPSEEGPRGNSSKYGDNGAAGRRPNSPQSNVSSTRSVPGIRSVSSTPTIMQRQSEGFARNFELPPLPTGPSATSGRVLPSVTRVAGVSSILNPPLDDESHQHRRRKVSHLESPTSSTQSLPPILAGPHAPHPTIVPPGHSPAAQYMAPNERPPRRILTPRSPSLHRAASLGQLNPSSGTISAQANPFPASPRGRPYMVEPGTAGAPPLPTPPVAARSGYGFRAPTPPTEAAGQSSAGATRTARLSASVSPTTSYSSYSQTGQTPPPTRYDPGSLSTLSAPYRTGGDGMNVLGAVSALPMAIESGGQTHMGIPISSSGGQNVYQMLTLETSSGTVQLPVDVQAASRVADEKRRRNAGASARFRQRRKEKEKEASTNISRLEQQVRDLGEDAEFYRRERDFLAGVLGHIPGGERHFPRPGSPRQRRPPGGSLPGPNHPESRGYTPILEQGHMVLEEGRNVRRRTSAFSLPPALQQHHQPSHPAGVPLQPNYGPLNPHHPPASHQPSTGPLPSPVLRRPLPLSSQAPGPPQVLQTVPQTGPWNPYASDRRTSGPQ